MEQLPWEGNNLPTLELRTSLGSWPHPRWALARYGGAFHLAHFGGYGSRHGRGLRRSGSGASMAHFTGFWSGVPEPWTVLNASDPNSRGWHRSEQHYLPGCTGRVPSTPSRTSKSSTSNSLNLEGTQNVNPNCSPPLLLEARRLELTPNRIPARIFLRRRSTCPSISCGKLEG